MVKKVGCCGSKEYGKLFKIWNVNIFTIEIQQGTSLQIGKKFLAVLSRCVLTTP
jgi:hypothetical protein